MEGGGNVEHRTTLLCTRHQSLILSLFNHCRPSYRKYDLSPRWLPPERFQFALDASAVLAAAARGKWPSVLFEVAWTRNLFEVPRGGSSCCIARHGFFAPPFFALPGYL